MITSMNRMYHAVGISKQNFHQQIIRDDHRAGMKVRRYRNYRRTTNSSGVIRFPNLTVALELPGANQTYCSDITYYDIAGEFYYLTFIMDIFSRRIVGWNAAATLL